MKNELYESGSLWRTRTKIRAYDCIKNNSNNKIITIPKNENVLLLSHIVGSTDYDHVLLLWGNKILQCYDIDIGHCFHFIQ